MKTETLLKGYVEKEENKSFIHLRFRSNKNVTKPKETYEKSPVYVAALAYLGFYIILLLGYLNQFLFPPKVAEEKNREGYPPLYSKFEQFYLNYVYRRIKDGWERPICSVPSAEIVIKDRVTHNNGWNFEFTGTETKYLNLGSYNYLGFAQASGPCADSSVEAVKKYGCATASTIKEIGTTVLHVQLERLTARFLGVEAAIVFGMGFATNALNMPSIMHPGCLVISDEKNHASLIVGLKLSGVAVRVYKHNDMEDLEKRLIESIAYGQPGTKKPWEKLFIVTEGIFSMEGSIVKLPSLLALKKKYKAYLYLDEAHSVGALGAHGRGVVDYYGCDPKDVDILMGTFTKSFGSAGGYIAGSKLLIDHIRATSDAAFYATSMPPPVAQQIITAMKIIMGEDGTNNGVKRIRRLARNTRYFRKRLHRMGCVIYGHDDSPVVPMLVYFYSKVTAVVRAFSEHHIATVGVGFPATPFLECRIRFCISAAHSIKQLTRILSVTEKIVNDLGLRYSRRTLRFNVAEFEREAQEDSE